MFVALDSTIRVWWLPEWRFPPARYQGMCLRTPTRISSAAAKAATTAQLSSDSSQFLFTAVDSAVLAFVPVTFAGIVFAEVPKVMLLRLTDLRLRS